MDAQKKQILEAKGWKVGSAEEFLNLSDEEVAFIELKLSLSRKVRELRTEKKLTQKESARLIGSSQSRIAKIEAGDPSVSIDLQVKSLIALGATRSEIAEAIQS